MSAKNLSIYQNWCRVLGETLIWKIQCRFGYFDTQKTSFDLNITDFNSFFHAELVLDSRIDEQSYGVCFFVVCGQILKHFKKK